MVKARKSRCAMSTTASTSSGEEAPIKYVCGIDIGSQACAGCICRPDKSLVRKPIATALGKEGWDVLLDKLSHLDARHEEILIGMQATARGSRELVPRVGAARLSALLVPSGTNASVSPASRAASQDGSPRCDDHCPRAAKLRGTIRLHSKSNKWQPIAHWCACRVN